MPTGLIGSTGSAGQPATSTASSRARSPPTKYELLVNLKTAKALGLGLLASVYARANEVIE